MRNLWPTEADHLARCAQAVADAERELHYARGNLDDAMTNAVAGANRAPVTEVASAAQVSRQTVYTALDRAARLARQSSP